MPLKHAMQPCCLGLCRLVELHPVTADLRYCRELDSGSSTPSSMPPSAAASPRRWSSFGNKARLSEDGSAMLRRASEAAGMAEAGLHLHSHAPPIASGATSPDTGTTYTLCTKNSQSMAPSQLGFTLTHLEAHFRRQKVEVLRCSPRKCLVILLTFFVLVMSTDSLLLVGEEGGSMALPACSQVATCIMMENKLLLASCSAVSLHDLFPQPHCRTFVHQFFTRITP